MWYDKHIKVNKIKRFCSPRTAGLTVRGLFVPPQRRADPADPPPEGAGGGRGRSPPQGIKKPARYGPLWRSPRQGEPCGSPGGKSLRTLQVESSTFVRFCQALFAGGKRAAAAALSSPATPDTGAVKGGPCGPTCVAFDGPQGRCYASPVRRPQRARSRRLERGRTPEASVSGPEGAAPEAPRADDRPGAGTTGAAEPGRRQHGAEREAGRAIANPRPGPRTGRGPPRAGRTDDG